MTSVIVRRERKGESKRRERRVEVQLLYSSMPSSHHSHRGAVQDGKTRLTANPSLCHHGNDGMNECHGIGHETLMDYQLRQRTIMDCHISTISGSKQCSHENTTMVKPLDMVRTRLNDHLFQEMSSNSDDNRLIRINKLRNENNYDISNDICTRKLPIIPIPSSSRFTNCSNQIKVIQSTATMLNKIVFMSMLFIMTILIIPSPCSGFNLEHRLPVIKKGDFNSLFGYSVAEHLIQDENRGRIIEAV